MTDIRLFAHRLGLRYAICEFLADAMKTFECLSEFREERQFSLRAMNQLNELLLDVKEGNADMILSDLGNNDGKV